MIGSWMFTYIVWFWVTIIKSIICGCFWWPFNTQTEWIVVSLFTLLFAISVWEWTEEDD